MRARWATGRSTRRAHQNPTFLRQSRLRQSRHAPDQRSRRPPHAARAQPGRDRLPGLLLVARSAGDVASQEARRNLGFRGGLGRSRGLSHAGRPCHPSSSPFPSQRRVRLEAHPGRIQAALSIELGRSMEGDRSGNPFRGGHLALVIGIGQVGGQHQASVVGRRLGNRPPNDPSRRRR